MSIAATCALILGGWSYHLDRSVDWTETHKAIGLSCNRWSAMAFTNSEGSEAYGAGYEYPLGNGFSAYAAVWTGYEGWDYGRPVGGLRYRWQAGPLALVATTAVEVSVLHVEVAF